MNINDFQRDISKRKFLKMGLFSSLALLSNNVFSNKQINSIILPHNNKIDTYSKYTKNTFNDIHKELFLYNMITGDSLNVTYFERGRYLPDALHEINYLYRDHLTDEVHPIDVALLDQLHLLKNKLKINKKINVICGYRSPFTNAKLRRNSHGVAKNSLHMEGRAIDIRIDGIDCKHIKNAAISMKQGGVGYYPENNFVHLDTGNFRNW